MSETQVSDQILEEAIVEVNQQLSVEDFLVHPTYVTIDKEEMKNDYYDLLEDTIILSKAEGLSAHSLSASYRLKKLKG